MALIWRHETNGTVPVFVVVPVHQACDPATRLQQALERFNRLGGAVLQGPELGLQIRVVIAHRRTTATRCHTQALHGGQHGFTLHGRAIVGVHHELTWCDALALADVLQQPTGQLRALAVIHLSYLACWNMSLPLREQLDGHFDL